MEREEERDWHWEMELCFKRKVWKSGRSMVRPARPSALLGHHAEDPEVEVVLLVSGDSD